MTVHLNLMNNKHQRFISIKDTFLSLVKNNVRVLFHKDFCDTAGTAMIQLSNITVTMLVANNVTSHAIARLKPSSL